MGDKRSKPDSQFDPDHATSDVSRSLNETRLSAPPQRPSPANQGKAVTLVIADATLMGCRLLADSLKSSGVEVVGSATDSRRLVQLVEEFIPDVSLVNATLQDGPTAGLKVLSDIHTRQPQVRIVALLDRSEPELVVEAFRAGAKGVFSRNQSDLHALRRCIQTVCRGQVWANSTELGYIMDALTRTSPLQVLDANGVSLLTKREEEVVRLVAEGLGNREIAAELNLSEHTIKNYLFRIFEKLGISTRVELVLHAMGDRGKALLSPENLDQASGRELRTPGEDPQDGDATASARARKRKPPV